MSKTKRQAALKMEVWQATIVEANTRSWFDEDDRLQHSLSLRIRDRNTRREISTTYPLTTAAEVGELRRFLVVFDFPLVDAGDLEPACERLRGCECRMEIRPRRDSTTNVTGVCEVDLFVDSRNSEDVWNHELHWKLGRREHPNQG